jgi:hypothetical protein
MINPSRLFELTLRRVRLAAFVLICCELASLLCPASFAQMSILPLGNYRVEPHRDGTFTIFLKAPPPNFVWQTRFGAPFSGIYETESSRILPNGARVTEPGIYERHYRDSAGRVRCDHLIRYSQSGNTGPFLVEILDPVSGFEYILDDQTHTAHRMPLSSKPPQLPSGSPPTEYVSASQKSVALPNYPSLPKAVTVTQPIGTQTMEGVTVFGMRETQTFPSGWRGINQPSVNTAENWYSPDLDMRIMMRQSNFTGIEYVDRMTQINLGDPDPSIFRVPEGYKVVDETGSFSITMKRAQ